VEDSGLNMIQLQHQSMKLPPSAATGGAVGISDFTTGTFKYQNMTVPPTETTEDLNTNAASSVDVSSLVPFPLRYLNAIDNIPLAADFASDASMGTAHENVNVKQQNVHTFISSSDCPIATFIFSTTKRPSDVISSASAKVHSNNVAVSNNIPRRSSIPVPDAVTVTTTMMSGTSSQASIELPKSRYDDYHQNTTMPTKFIPPIDQRNVDCFNDQHLLAPQEYQGAVPAAIMNASYFYPTMSTTKKTSVQKQDSDVSNENSADTSISPLPLVKRKRRKGTSGNGIEARTRKTASAIRSPDSDENKDESRNGNAAGGSSSSSSRTSGSGMARFLDDIDMEDSDE
jgi:hypothetical protein